MAVRMTVSLDKNEVEVLMKPVNGQGGFQNLVRKLQTRVRGRRVWFTPDEVVTLHRYVTNTGSGGFQGRLSPLLGAFREVTDAFVEMYAR